MKTFELFIKLCLRPADESSIHYGIKSTFSTSELLLEYEQFCQHFGLTVECDILLMANVLTKAGFVVRRTENGNRRKGRSVQIKPWRLDVNCYGRDPLWDLVQPGISKS